MAGRRPGPRSKKAEIEIARGQETRRAGGRPRREPIDGDRKLGRLAPIAVILPAAGLVASCDGPQSALVPRARQAVEVAALFEWMAWGAVAIWAAVMLAAILAVLRPAMRGGSRRADRLIIFGGVVFPTVVLAALLAAGLRLLPDWGHSPARLRVEVGGEQFWWRVAYARDDLAVPVRTANEIHLPAGEPVEFVLSARDVIHSFWIPSLAGKMDMIPGRVNRLLVEDPQPGVYRGVCAEFCGTGHALMAFTVVVHPPESFEAWLAAEARPAASEALREGPPDAAAEGRRLFLDHGCGACHPVRGLVEAGDVGPDLTHFAARATLGAGLAPISRETVADWMRDPQALKPGARMPGYGALMSEAELETLADWLLELR